MIQLQFEWACQNVDKSKSFREAVGDDELGAEGKARLENSRILWKECLPFFMYSLTVYFPWFSYSKLIGMFYIQLSNWKQGHPLLLIQTKKT